MKLIIALVACGLLCVPPAISKDHPKWRKAGRIICSVLLLGAVGAKGAADGYVASNERTRPHVSFINATTTDTLTGSQTTGTATSY